MSTNQQPFYRPGTVFSFPVAERLRGYGQVLAGPTSHMTVVVFNSVFNESDPVSAQEVVTQDPLMVAPTDDGLFYHRHWSVYGWATPLELEELKERFRPSQAMSDHLTPAVFVTSLKLSQRVIPWLSQYKHDRHLFLSDEAIRSIKQAGVRPDLPPVEIVASSVPLRGRVQLFALELTGASADEARALAEQLGQEVEASNLDLQVDGVRYTPASWSLLLTGWGAKAKMRTFLKGWCGTAPLPCLVLEGE